MFKTFNLYLWLFSYLFIIYSLLLFTESNGISFLAESTQNYALVLIRVHPPRKYKPKGQLYSKGNGNFFFLFYFSRKHPKFKYMCTSINTRVNPPRKNKPKGQLYSKDSFYSNLGYKCTKGQLLRDSNTAAVDFTNMQVIVSFTVDIISSPEQWQWFVSFSETVHNVGYIILKVLHELGKFGVVR